MISIFAKEPVKVDSPIISFWKSEYVTEYEPDKKLETLFDVVYGISTKTSLSFKTSIIFAVWDGLDIVIVFSSTSLSQEPLVLCNLYKVPALQVLISVPKGGSSGIPWTYPVSVTVGTDFENMGFTNSVIVTWGLL